MTEDEIISHLEQLHPYWKHRMDTYLQRKGILGPEDRVRVYTILDGLFSKKQQSHKVMSDLANFITEASPNDEEANSTAMNIVENIFDCFYRLKNDKVFDNDQTRRKAAFLIGYGEVLLAVEYRIGLEKLN